MRHYSAIMSTAALVVALTIGGAYASGVIVTSKQIKNGSILSVDLKNNGIKGSDIKNGAIDSADVENGGIGSQDLSLPPPVQITEPAVTGPVNTTGFSKIADVGQYVKVDPTSILQVEWNGAVADGAGTNCLFQLRVNGAASAQGGGEVFSQGGAVNVATAGLFPGLAAGPVNIEVWAKAYAAILATPTCVIGPAYPGVANTFIVSEATV